MRRPLRNAIAVLVVAALAPECVYLVAANIFLRRERTRRGLLDFKAMRDVSSRTISTLGFEIDPDRLVGQLSLVEKEVVEIAKAMLLEPRILILDEVTAPLDCSLLLATDCNGEGYSGSLPDCGDPGAWIQCAPTLPPLSLVCQPEPDGTRDMGCR